MDIQVEKALSEIGLTQGEIKAYLALLELKEANASDISKKADIHRVNTYEILGKLEEKGLVTHIERNSQKIYVPGDPDHLVKVLEQKKETLLAVIPSIKKKLLEEKKGQKVYHLFGEQGVIQAYYMMLNQGKEVLGLGGSGNNRKYLGFKHEIWNKKRLAKNMNMRVIYYEFTRKERSQSWDKKTDKTVQIRYLPDEQITPCMIDICGNLVVNLIPTENNIQVVVIENQELAQTYKTFFEMLWKQAKE